MLRRSLSVLLLLSLLGLVMILVFALLNSDAAVGVLARAESLLAERKPKEALQKLHNARPKDPGLQRRWHLLRAEAYEQTDRPAKALQEVAALIDHHSRQLNEGQRLDLRRAEVRLLTRLGTTTDPVHLTGALERAGKILADHPDDSEVLELSGKVLQVRYREELDRLLNEDFPVHFGAEDLDDAVVRLIAFLYREPGDPEGTRRQSAFEADLRQRIADEMTYAELVGKIRGVQAQIRKSVDFYRRALRGEESAFAAFQGYSGMLLRGGRLDEALALSWIYLQRFPGEYGTVIPAERAMDCALRAANPTQAIAAGDAWLGAAGIPGHLEEFDLTERTVNAATLLVRALYAKGEGRRIFKIAEQLNKSDRPSLTWPTTHLVYGLSNLLDDDVKRGLPELRRFCAAWPKAPPREGFDYYGFAMAVRLEQTRRLQDDDKTQEILDTWIADRPGAPEPRLARGRLLLRSGKPWLAAKDASEVMKDEGVDRSVRDGALQLLLDARNKQHARDRQDAKSLFAAVAQSGETLPVSVRDPVLFLGIAQHAVAAGKYEIARASLDEAAQHFSWSTKLRRLQARCRKGIGQSPLFDLERALSVHPNDLESRLLQIEALAAHPDRRRAAELELVTRHPEHPRAALLIARRLLERREHALALQAATSSVAAKHPGIGWVKGRALLGLGDRAGAIAELVTVPADAPERAAAIALALETAATLSGRTDIPDLRGALIESKPDGATLRRVASSLVRKGLLSDAYRLLYQVERRPDMAEERNGALFLLLGRIRAKMGHLPEAQSYWQRAFGFEDGNDAMPLLALSHLLEGDAPAAREALHFAPALTGDPITVAYLHYLRGDGEKALAELAKFRTKSTLLQTVLTMAFELAIEPEKEPSQKTHFRWINELVEFKPALVLEALALARGLAFEDRSKAALDKLEAEYPNEELFDKASLGLLRAYRELLAGRKEEACAQLLRIVQPAPAFFPAYDDLIRLGEEIHPESLFRPDMLYRYVGLAFLLPPQMLFESRFSTIYFRGLANLDLVRGDYGMAENWLRLAHIVAPTDGAPLFLIAEGARRRGDYATALENRLKAHQLLGSEIRTRDMARTLEIALEAQQKDEARDPKTKLGGLVRGLASVARTWLQQPASTEHPPLGLAATLVARALPDEEESGDVALEVLQDCLAPYANGQLPPRLDAAGIPMALEELRSRGHGDVALTLVRKILIRDPSWIELWLWRATMHEDAGDVDAALRSVQWIPRILPQATGAISTVARLHGSHPTKDRAARQHLLERLGELRPATPAVQAARALLTMREGRLEEALELFDDAGELDGRVAWLRDVTAILAGATKELPEIAARMTERALQTDDPLAATSGEIARQLRYLIVELEPDSDSDNEDDPKEKQASEPAKHPSPVPAAAASGGK